MKIAHGIIASFITGIQHGLVDFLKEAVVLTNTHFIQKIDVGILGAAFENNSKRRHTHTGNSNYLRQVKSSRQKLALEPTY